MKKILENVGVGTELDKRFSLDNTVIKKQCKCGEVLEYDLGFDYLSYPRVGYPETISMYCDNCMEDWEAVMKVTVVVNLVIEDL